LKSLGWVSLEARAEPEHGLFAPLLEELRNERSVHTWRQHLPESGHIDEDSTRLLHAAEEAYRPTLAFGYVATELDGGEVIVAAGAVSTKIRADFPHEGFPVLARCFVRPQFRKRGLYRHILGHRLEYCLERWGSQLKAIHLGSASSAVWEAVALHGGFALNFVHVGDEDLEVRGEVHRIPALMAFHPSYKRAVIDASLKNGFDNAFRRELEDLVFGRTARASWTRLRAMADDQHTHGNVALPAELAQLFALGDAIPLRR